MLESSRVLTKLKPALVLLCLLLAAAAADKVRERAQRQFLQTQSYEDLYYLPPSDSLVIGSLGYREALADLLWMKALVYYGEELLHRGEVRHLFRYGDAVLALDPEFRRVYRWVASSALYRTGNVSADDVYAAIRYLEVAARRFPDDGELAWDLGANYAFELAAQCRPAVARFADRHATQRARTPRAGDSPSRRRVRDRERRIHQVADRKAAGWPTQ
jgi:hypothetical protein